MSSPNFELYQQSISDEFVALKNRARNIIGSANWALEGRYKEIILANMLKKSLPKHLSIGTGFAMNFLGDLTKQIDIIIYDNRFPLIFSEGDFIVASTQNVVGIIEVKTKVYIRQINEVIKTAHENGLLIGKHIFNGIFAFENIFNLSIDIKQSSIKLKAALERYNGFVNHICFGENYFIKYWKMPEREFYSIYKINKFSFPYFISNLIEKTYKLTIDNNEQSSKIDYISNSLYGIEAGKESGKVGEILIKE